jgi:hypothetical protein
LLEQAEGKRNPQMKRELEAVRAGEEFLCVFCDGKIRARDGRALEKTSKDSVSLLV